MALFDNYELPDTPTLAPVRAYLEAQAAQDLSSSADFFAEDIVFNGLVLTANGRAEVAGAIEGFLKQAIEFIEIEAIAEIGEGHVLALYWFKLKPAAEKQILVDRITVANGAITRIDNCFDVRKLPPM